MSKAETHIIKTRDLSIGYSSKKGNTIVQSDINLSLEKGKFVAVLGKNGIGKSTLLRTLTKVQPSLSGSISLNDKLLESISDQDLSKTISVVLTERLPESQLTVFELVALGRQPYTNWVGNLQNSDIEKVNWALEQTDAFSLASKHYYELSDGQLQRVLIARALAQDTDIIVLDEPTAHLDLHHTLKIFKLLKKLVETTEKTIIISSHEVNLSIKMADLIVLILDDKVISGSKEELISNQSFESLFPSEIIDFNKSLEQFIVKE